MQRTTYEQWPLSKDSPTCKWLVLAPLVSLPGSGFFWGTSELWPVFLSKYSEQWNLYEPLFDVLCKNTLCYQSITLQLLLLLSIKHKNIKWSFGIRIYISIKKQKQNPKTSGFLRANGLMKISWMFETDLCLNSSPFTGWIHQLSSL